MTPEQIQHEVILWLNRHQSGYVEINDDWRHFVSVLTDCCIHVVNIAQNESSQAD